MYDIKSEIRRVGHEKIMNMWCRPHICVQSTLIVNFPLTTYYYSPNTISTSHVCKTVCAFGNVENKRYVTRDLDNSIEHEKIYRAMMSNLKFAKCDTRKS